MPTPNANPHQAMHQLEEQLAPLARQQLES